MEKLFKKIIFNTKKNILFSLIFSVLLGLSFIYKIIITTKRKRGYKLEAGDSFIISIGNLTTGGTGKTPFAIFLANKLAKKYKVCIILRGYKSRYNKKPFLIKNLYKYSAIQLGDEPLLIAQETKLPVIISKKRIDGIKYAKKKIKPQIIILDDAFQHFQLKRNINIVLIDYFNPFGNKYLLPAGILREPIDALKDADYVIITKYEKIVKKEYSFKKLKSIIKSINPNTKLFASNFILSELRINNRKVNLKKYLHKKVLIISGIANPEYFEFLVKRYLKPKKIFSLTFPDHHYYRKKDIELIINESQKYDIIITTEKDYIKLKKFNIPIFVFKIKFNFQNEKEFLKAIANEIKKN